MSRPGAGYDRLARWYRALEVIAFGRALEHARFAFLDRLGGSPRVLLIGEGDGRCAERLAAIAPGASILCVDSSPAMVERASRRLSLTPASGRVRFRCADIRSFDPGAERFDAVATLFVLDCFDAAGVASIVSRVGTALVPGALWLFADFTLPPRGPARLRARAWLAVLFAFFRWETGLGTAVLPPSEEILEAGGWRRLAARTFQGGLLTSAVYAREAPTGAPAASASPGPTANR